MDSTALSIGSVAVTGALTFLGTCYRDWRKDKTTERQRQWDREDREEQARARSVDLAKHAERITTAQTGALLAAVADNTQVSVQAFDTANGYNQKIASLHGKIADLHGRMDGIDEALAKISAKLQ